MKLLKISQKEKPKVSFILLDWSVRESFHIGHYLKNQTVSQDDFEVVLVEHYSTISSHAKKFENSFDTWAILEMPESSCFHKHLMYNIGFLLSKGEIVVICDSDAMVKPTFVESILKTFEENPSIVLHMDQIRSSAIEYYPFNYPSFEDIERTSFNFKNGVTKALSKMEENSLLFQNPFELNYGACFACRREDYISIGGSDEHIDFIGYICGPYDLTFRLNNKGIPELWHRKEVLYHSWHPNANGQFGGPKKERLGPHKNYMAFKSLEARSTDRSEPYVINPLIEELRAGKQIDLEDILERGISDYCKENSELCVLELLGSLDNSNKCISHIEQLDESTSIPFVPYHYASLLHPSFLLLLILIFILLIRNKISNIRLPR